MSRVTVLIGACLVAGASVFFAGRSLLKESGEKPVVDEKTKAEMAAALQPVTEPVAEPEVAAAKVVGKKKPDVEVSKKSRPKTSRKPPTKDTSK